MSAAGFVSEVWGLQGTAYVVVALRYYARFAKSGWKGLAWDDGLMFLATLVYTAESVAAYTMVKLWKGFANNTMTDEERAALVPNSIEWNLRTNGSKTHVIGLLLYITLLWILKGCWVVYYSRLTAGLPRRRQLVMIAAFVIPLTYISCLLVACFKCIPFNHQWQIYPNPGNSCMPAVSLFQTIYVMILNAVTDIYLMTIPIPMIWKSQLEWKNKLSIIILFSGGLVQMIFGVLRCVSILTTKDRDPSLSGFWSVRESFVSYVLTNLPLIYPLIRGVIEKTRASTSKSNDRTRSMVVTNGKNGYRLDSLSTQRARQSEAESKKRIVSQYDIMPLPSDYRNRVSFDDESSQDSFTIANNLPNMVSPGNGLPEGTVSSQVSAARGPMTLEAELAQGILVTRAYERTVTERQSS